MESSYTRTDKIPNISDGGTHKELCNELKFFIVEDKIYKLKFIRFINPEKNQNVEKRLNSPERDQADK